MGRGHICLFTTGRGTPIGNACMTTIKITGNSRTSTALADMIDYSATLMLYRQRSLKESDRELYEILIRVANGEPTKSEKLGDYSWTTPHGISYNYYVVYFLFSQGIRRAPLNVGAPASQNGNRKPQLL